MQTILGANGIIATELAKELCRQYTTNIRLVSRHPRKVNDTDELVTADLLDAAQTAAAVQGSDIVYLVAGLPYQTAVWQAQWPVVMRNVIDACKCYGAKLVFFDNVYMYGPVKGQMTEETFFGATSKKGRVRAQIASMLLEEIGNKTLTAMICRAPEFYGPAHTQSSTNATIFDNIRKKKRLQVLLKDSTLRTLIYTPDAGRATALLGNTPDAYHETWHLPCDTNRLTAMQFIAEVGELHGITLKYTVLKAWMVKLVGLFNPLVKEVVELLYQYEQDYIFDCSKFMKRFPGFTVTPIQAGIKTILAEL